LDAQPCGRFGLLLQDVPCRVAPSLRQSPLPPPCAHASLCAAPLPGSMRSPRMPVWARLPCLERSCRRPWASAPGSPCGDAT